MPVTHSVKMLQFERLIAALVDSVSDPSRRIPSAPFPLSGAAAAAARQQRQRGAKMVNNDWQLLIIIDNY